MFMSEGSIAKGGKQGETGAWRQWSLVLERQGFDALTVEGDIQAQELDCRWNVDIDVFDVDLDGNF